MVVRDNVLVKGFSGKSGSLIFKKVGDKTVVTFAPSYKKRKWSQAQSENRKRFSEAMAFARRVLSDPEAKEYYKKRKKRGQTVWNSVLSEYLLQPLSPALPPLGGREDRE